MALPNLANLANLPRPAHTCQAKQELEEKARQAKAEVRCMLLTGDRYAVRYVIVALLILTIN